MLKGNKSLLMVACKMGVIECARVLLDHNADINYRTYNHDSALKCACLSGNLDMLRLIIERGVTINDVVIAKLFESEELVRNTGIATILVGYIQNVNIEGQFNCLLYSACRAGNAAIACLLIERGALLLYVYYDPLEAASRNGHLEVVTVLLGHYTVEVPVYQERIRQALLYASEGGHAEVLRCLIAHGLNADTVALNSSLFQAVKEHHVEVAAALLDAGADFDALIHHVLASRQSHADDGFWSSWIYACRQGRPDMVRLLLARGADPNPAVAIGFSPLEAILLHPDALRVLLEHGADPNRLSNGCTALLDLVRYQRGDYMQAITVLLENGADVNLMDATTGQTALMIAAVERNVDIVKLLLEYGADVTQVNREGKSVLDMLGRTRKYSEVAELCTQYIDSNKPGAKLLLK